MPQPLQTYEMIQDDTEWKLEVFADPEPENPRLNQENLGTMVYTHRNYVLGDRRIDQASMDEYLEEQGLPADQIVSLPLYLLDHSGLALSVDDFNDPWDSGCVGCIYTTEEKIKNEFGVCNDQTREQALNVLRAEVEQMHQYVSGEIYGFVLSSRPFNSQDEWEMQDTAWGFCGSNPAQNGMLDHLEGEWKAILSPSMKNKTP